MNFIKKIFDGKIDDSVHSQFQKFSKGEFRDRALIRAKFSAGKYTIKTTAEFAKEMVRVMAGKLGDEKVRVTGAVISTLDLKGELEFENIKQFQGVKKYLIDSEMSGNEIIGLLDKFPKAFFALSFVVKDGFLKITPKAPKSGKPKGKKKGEKFNPNFCKLVTKDAELGKSFVFEKPDFKLAEITHHYIITGIEVPEEFKDDFAKAREKAKKVGKIVREAIIDEKEVNSEKDFRA